MDERLYNYPSQEIRPLFFCLCFLMIHTVIYLLNCKQKQYVYTFKLIMTLRGVFYNHLHIELHACTGHAHSPGDFININ